MATTYNPDPDANNNTIFSSSFQKTVSLHDWWLIKAENDFNGKTLAVGGLESRGYKATRIFSSAPIVKRYDMLNLETADGITVFINGFINRSRTQENGISFEVCNHFLIGFPYNWENFSYRGEGSVSANIFGRASDCGNPNDGESEGYSSGKKSEDATPDFVAQKNAEISGTSGIELHKTEHISTVNNVGAEVVSSCSKLSNDREPTSPFEARSNEPKRLEEAGKLDSENNHIGQCETRRSNRLKILKGTGSRQETERNKSIHVSVGSDLVKSVGNEMDCESGGRNVLDDPSVGPHETVCKSALKVNSECQVLISGAKSSDQNESCRSYERLGDVHRKRKRRVDNELGISKRQTKKSEECVADVKKGECGNLKDGGSKGNSSDEKSEDAAIDFLAQKNAEISAPSDTGLHKTEHMSKGNKVGAEVVSSSSKIYNDSKPTSSFEARRSNGQKDLEGIGTMDNDNDPIGPFEARRSNRLKTFKGMGNR